MRIKALFLFLFLFHNTLIADYKQSVVRISSSLQSYDYKKPWEPQKSKNITGSGVIIKNKYILTAAHVVLGAKTIQVTKSAQKKKYYAKVKYISPQADLALLELFDKSFFKGTKSLNFSKKIKTKQKVLALGYPNSRKSLLIKKGTISKVKHHTYFLSNESFLALHLNINIARGNSGGPILNKNNEIIGIAMQIPKAGSNKAYAVPLYIINTFLEDIKDGKVDGFHSNSNSYQYLENQILQEYYKTDEVGMLVTGLDLEEEQLKVDDIILKINSKKVSKLGKRAFYFAFHSKPASKTIKLQIKRAGKLLNIDYKLNRTLKLVSQEFNKKPRFFVFEGLIFTPITRNYLQALGLKQFEINMLFYKEKRVEKLQEPVAWMDIKFPNKKNRGYISKVEIVDKVNETKVRSFNHFKNLVENSNEKYVVIDFVNKQRVVLEKEEIIKGKTY